MPEPSWADGEAQCALCSLEHWRKRTFALNEVVGRWEADVGWVMWGPAAAMMNTSLCVEDSEVSAFFQTHNCFHGIWPYIAGASLKVCIYFTVWDQCTTFFLSANVQFFFIVGTKTGEDILLTTIADLHTQKTRTYEWLSCQSSVVTEGPKSGIRDSSTSLYQPKHVIADMYFFNFQALVF